MPPPSPRSSRWPSRRLRPRPLLKQGRVLIDGRPPLAASNPRIKQLRRLVRRRSARLEEGLFVVEGLTLVREALAMGAPVRSVLIDETVVPEVPVVPLDGSVDAHSVEYGVLSKALDTVTPHFVVALVERPNLQAHDVLRVRPALVPVLAEVADPGNVGTLMRSAGAAGASGVVVTSGSADPFGPKAVRASAGGVLRLPVAEVAVADTGALLEEAHLRVVVADADADRSIDHADLSGDLAIVVGNEARGVPDDLRGAAVERVAVPMAAGTESLNVAAAGAVLLFEAARQRRMGVPDRGH